VPDAAPANLWFGPLLLIDRTPASVVAEIPCSLPPDLRGATQPVTVLATGRDPERHGGLAVLRDGQMLVVKIGGRILLRADVPRASTRSTCHYELRVANGAWSMTGGRHSIARNGTLDSAPVVSSLFSELDLRQPGSPKVRITTLPHAGSAITRQKVAWSLAVIAALAALVIVSTGSRKRPVGLDVRRVGRSIRASAGLVDLAVGAFLVAWWIISPANVDDGWIFARERAYSEAHGFTNYYDALGTNLPNDYWLEWIQHWLAEATSALVLLRLPALFCLLATWIVCRWILNRFRSSDRETSSGALWVLAVAFLAGAVAWDMTLRPEPITALLATGSLACAVVFQQRPSAVPLAVAAVLAPLALTAHYTGIVVVAPLLAISPLLLRWGRHRLSASAILVTASAALLVVLATIGSDFGQRLADARSTRAATSAPQDAWYDELARYERLSEVFFATPLRRGAVALIFLVALMFVFRRVRRRSEIDLPARALIVSLPLFFATAGKLPWHFGALIGFAAVAASAESLRLRREAQRASGVSVRPYVFCMAALLGAGWAWAVRGPWAPIDLRTLTWGSDLEHVVPLDVIAPLLPVLALCALLLRGIATHSRALYTAPWNVAALTAPLLVVPLLSVTLLVFAFDTGLTGSWTLGRQNLETLTGALKCGLADDVVVTSRNGASSRSLAELLEKDRVRTFVNPNRLAYFPCVRVPLIHDGIAEPPDFVIAPWQSDALPVAYENSPFIGLLDAYHLRPLTLGGSGPWREISVYAVERVPGSKELDAARVTAKQ
jgi:hypothetical protein